MSSMSMGISTASPRPPDKGIFPLDHFHECDAPMKEYLACLKRKGNDNFSCRYLSKEYLKCRMDHQLMANESMEKLGFIEGADNVELPPRETKKSKKSSKEAEGFNPSIGSAQANKDKTFFETLFGKGKIIKLIKSKWEKE